MPSMPSIAESPLSHRQLIRATSFIAINALWNLVVEQIEAYNYAIQQSAVYIAELAFSEDYMTEAINYIHDNNSVELDLDQRRQLVALINAKFEEVIAIDSERGPLDRLILDRIYHERKQRYIESLRL